MTMGINVLSMCDGMSCGQIALKELGIEVDHYYASEIDKNAIKVTQSNFPETVQLGDVLKIDEETLKTLPKIDLVIFGSPCRSLSLCTMGDRKGKNYCNGLEGISGLFLNCVDILKWIKKNNNKDVLFLSENVVNMKHKETYKVMSDYIGCEPVELNSNWFSAQDRDRYYWTNIPLGELPEQCTDVLNDVMETEVDEHYYYKQGFTYRDETQYRSVGDLDIKGHNIIRRVFSRYYKSPTLTACRGGNTQKKVYDNGRVRKLTPLEYRRLQTIPEWYKMDVANSHIYNMCGDGWNINTIKYLFQNIPDVINGLNNTDKSNQAELVH